MSRDLTPKELEFLAKENCMTNIMFSLKIQDDDGNWQDVYSDEDKELAHQFPKLSLIGADFLFKCRDLGYLSSIIGRNLLHQVEKTLSTGEDFGELSEITRQWYNGELMSGYYMINNDNCFVDYISEKIKEKENYNES